MKRTFLVAWVPFLFLTACSNQDTSQIERSAQGYLDAMGNYLIDDAAPYATRQTREKTIPTFNRIMAICDTNYINSNRPATITLHGTKMLTDTSALVYYHKSTPIMEDDDSLLVIFEGGQWLVEVQLGPIPILSGQEKPKGADILKKVTPKKIVRKIPADSLNKKKMHQR